VQIRWSYDLFSNFVPSFDSFSSVLLSPVIPSVPLSPEKEAPRAVLECVRPGAHRLFYRAPQWGTPPSHVSSHYVSSHTLSPLLSWTPCHQDCVVEPWYVSSPQCPFSHPCPCSGRHSFLYIFAPLGCSCFSHLSFCDPCVE